MDGSPQQNQVISMIYTSLASSKFFPPAWEILYQHHHSVAIGQFPTYDGLFGSLHLPYLGSFTAKPAARTVRVE
jgi:hypothetical protein